MKRVLLSLTLLLTGFGLTQAQSTLSPGDIAITAYSADNPDEFSFVLLANVISGTEISFTDLPWDSATMQFATNTEGYFTWKATTNFPAGTLINVVAPNSAGDDYESDYGIVSAPSGSAMLLSATGDQILAFQGTIASPIFIFALNYGANDWMTGVQTLNSNKSYLPSGLTNGVNALYVGDFDNGYYDSDSINIKAFLLSSIVDSANWNGSNSRTNFDPSENGRQGFLIGTSSPYMRNSTAIFKGDFGQTQINTPTGGSNFFIGGSNLTANIVVSVNAPFEVRVGAGSFSSSVNISPASGTVNPTAVEVRFNPTAGVSYADTIQITSTGAFTNQLLVSGEGLASPIVNFLSSSVTFTEGGVNAFIEIAVANRGSNSVMVDLISKPLQTALEGLHFIYTNGPQIIFDGSTPDTIAVEITLPDDINSGPRFRTNKIGFVLTGAMAGGTDSFSLSIAENDYKVAAIAEIKQLDANFLPISYDSLFEVTGVVYGTNTRNFGYSFTIIDGSAGISNFAPSSASDFGYTITEGDSIMMRGRLTSFNGLIQLDFLDTIQLLKANTPLKDPIVLNTLGEEAENEFVRINNVAFVTPTPTWSVSGSGSNYKVYNTLTMDTFDVRVIASSTLANEPAPTGLFDIMGLGGQFDGSNPRNSGYQLFPRYASDVFVDKLGIFDLISPANNSTITLGGDPTQTAEIVWSSSEALNGGSAPSYTFLLDLPTGNFSAPLLSVSSGTDTSTSFTYKALADAFGTSLPIGGTLSLQWTVKADNGGQEEWAQSTFMITFERSVLDGLVTATQVARIFPNPANGVVHIQMEAAADQMKLYDMTGKLVYSHANPSASQEINLAGFNNGVYILQISQNGALYQARIVVSNK